MIEGDAVMKDSTRSKGQEGSVEQQSGQVAYVPAGQGPALRVLSQLIVFKKRAEAGPYTLLESIDQPHSGPPPHIHHTQDEAFYVLEGQYEFLCGEETITAGPGSFMHIPRGTVHTLQNVGEGPARALVLLTPPGPLERLFKEVGEQVTDSTTPMAPAAPPDMDKLMASARRNQMELLLPREA